MSVQIKLTPQKRDGTLDTQHAIVLSGRRMPDGYNFTNNIPGHYYRNVLGYFVGLPTNYQRDLEVSWSHLTDADYDYIAIDGIQAAIIRNNWHQFKLEVLPASGDTQAAELRKKFSALSDDGIVYVGSPQRTEYAGENDNTMLWNLKITLTQVTPVILNRITDAQL